MGKQVVCPFCGGVWNMHITWDTDKQQPLPVLCRIGIVAFIVDLVQRLFD